jgi:hypothetical protein
MLTPVRLWHAVHTGGVTDSDEAVEHDVTTTGARNAGLAGGVRVPQAAGDADLAVVAQLLDEHLVDLYVEVLELVVRAPDAAGFPSRGAIEHALQVGFRPVPE